MADPESEFRPKERREAKQFEPPPWEREQFEELARQRAAQEAEQARWEMEAAAASAAVAGPEAYEPETVSSSVVFSKGPVEAVLTTERTTIHRPVLDVASGDVSPVGASAEEAPKAEDPPGPDEAALTEMLAGLASEEPRVSGAVRKATVAIGAAVIVLGGLFVYWGITALAGMGKTGTVGALGGGVLLLFGTGFVAGGGWVVMKNLREQGVL